VGLEASVRTLTEKLNSVTKAFEAKIESLRKALGSPIDEIQPVKTRKGSQDEGTLTMKCPAGIYMCGISYDYNKGSSHGIVSHIRPIIKTFLPKSNGHSDELAWAKNVDFVSE
jgi:hypothetical protein